MQRTPRARTEAPLYPPLSAVSISRIGGAGVLATVLALESGCGVAPVRVWIPYQAERTTEAGGGEMASYHIGLLLAPGFLSYSAYEREEVLLTLTDQVMAWHAKGDLYNGESIEVINTEMRQALPWLVGGAVLLDVDVEHQGGPRGRRSKGEDLPGDVAPNVAPLD